MNTRIVIAQFAGVIGLVVAASVGDGLAGTNHDLSWNTIDGGGGVSSSGTLVLAGTIAQPDAGGPLTDGNYELVGGFWPGAMGIDDCPADISNDGAVNVTDLLAVIGSWGVCPSPCPPHCAADIAPAVRDCAVNVTDLLAVIGAWGACP